MSKVRYWLEGEAQQNFGDYFSEYLKSELFYDLRADGCEIRLIGSCIHDSFVPGGYDSGEEAAEPTAVFWGCGVREPGGLSEAARKRADIRAVRGPVSANELRLGADVPACDPALVLPALYTPKHRAEFAGRSICIPHFHDQRTNQEILAANGADLVLRPNIPLGPNHLLRFIDAMTSADFVLTASLHGAIVAAAYGRPFAYWRSAIVDLPIKWDDFSGSAGFKTVFVDTVKAGRKAYADAIERQIRLPSTLPLLAVAPLPLKASGLAAVLRYELDRADPVDRAVLLGRFAEAAADHQPDIDRLMRHATDIIHRYDGGDGDPAQSNLAIDQLLAFAARTLDLPLADGDPTLREDKAAALLAIAQDGRETARRQAAQIVSQAARIEELEQSAATLKQAIGNLEETAAEMERAIAVGRVTIAEAETRETLRREELVRSAEDQAILRQDRDRLDGEIAALRRDLLAARAMSDTQLAEIAALQADYAALTDRLEALARDRAELTDTLDEAIRQHRLTLAEEREEAAGRAAAADASHKLALAKEREHAASEMAAADASHKLAMSEERERGASQHRTAITEEQRQARERAQAISEEHVRTARHLQAALAQEQARAAAADAQRIRDHEQALLQEQRQGRVVLRRLRDAVNRARLAEKQASACPAPPIEEGARTEAAIVGAMATIVGSGLFDADWYARQIGEPTGDAQALLHRYVAGGGTAASPHPLFDTAYYLAAHPEVADHAGTPLEHFLDYGWLAGHRPHALFDPEYYLDQAPEVAIAGTPPLLDYLARGWIEGLRPNPLFDPHFYLAHNEDVRTAAIEPLTHYAAFGWRERRDPHPLVDLALYLECNDDLVAADVEPIAHYLGYGRHENRQLVLLFDADFYQEQRGALLAGDADPLDDYLEAGWRQGASPHPLFDVAFYRQEYLGANGTGTDPLLHFMAVGRALQYTANPLFDPVFYLAHAPDVVADGSNAFLHYLARGGAEGRAPNPVFHSTGYAFDHPDVADFGGNPLLHYQLRGRAAGHLPHPLFDPNFYLARYADIGASGMDPYEHYVRYGRTEGRQASEVLVPGRAPHETAIRFPDVPDPEATVIIPVYRSFADTFRCLYSISETFSPKVRARILIADDCPERPVAPLFADIPNLAINTNPVNHGFLRNCNAAAAATSGEFIVFLNNDTVVREGWLEAMVDLARRDQRNALVGCKLLNADGTIQEAGGIMFTDGWGYPYGRNDSADRPEYNYVREVDCVIGACFLVRRSVFEAVGGFDDRYYPAFFEEFDLAMEVAEAGYKVLYQPASEVMHLGSASYGAEVRDRQSLINQAQFKTKWAHRLARGYAGTQDLFLARDGRHRSGTILIVDDLVPEFDKHAGALTMYQYLKLMAELDFKVVYRPHYRTATQPYTSIYQQMGIEILYGDIDMTEWLKANGRYLDWVWLARPDVATPYIDDVRAHTNARLLYYTHDLHFLREQRRYEVDGDDWALSESIRLLPIETAIFEQVDCVMTPSGQEAVIISDMVPAADVKVLTPYFFNSAAYVVPEEALPLDERREIIFVGGYRHVPNVDAAVRLVRSIMPKVWKKVPDAKVLLVGSHPPTEVQELSDGRVDVVGFVDDLAPWYARARMSVSPLRYGAGVKGKIVGSLEAGVPVVTTTIGNEGLALEPGVEAMIGDSDDELADGIIHLFRDKALLETLRIAGLAVIHQRFSEEGARDLLLDALGMRLCNVCGVREHAPVPYPASGNWREEPACLSCWALNRMTSLADVILKPYRPLGVSSIADAVPFLHDLRIHEFGFVGSVHDQLKDLPHFTDSDFFDDVPPGERAINGVMCQDLQALTFPDREIDLCISQDVLEHVPDPWAAFREIHRVLKPSGRHVFTIPYNGGTAHSVVRAKLGEDGITHILPPEYHGDPIRNAGALVFTDFGRDILERLDEIGFRVTITEVVRDEVGGGYTVVFSTRKIEPVIEDVFRDTAPDDATKDASRVALA